MMIKLDKKKIYTESTTLNKKNDTNADARFLCVSKPSCYVLFFIARQHAIHAERDYVMANLLLRLSVCHTMVLY